MLYFKLYPFTLLKQSRSFTFLFMFHILIWVNCCSIISQVIIYLKVFKRWISILNLALFSSTLPVALLVVDLSLSHSLLLWFSLLRTSSHLLVVDLSPSQSFFLCFAQHLESLCSLQTCLNYLNLSCFVLNTSTRSARCSVVSGGYIYSKYSYFRRTSSCKLPSSLPIKFPSLLNILTFFSSLSFRFLSSCFLYFRYSVFTSIQPSWLRTPLLNKCASYYSM